MKIRYSSAPDIEDHAREICIAAGISRDMTRIHFVRSRGSRSKFTVARCHTTPRILQHTLNIKAHYVIEVISEKFDRLSDKEKTKTIIHELLHIPKSMGGGFRHHNYVCIKNIENVYRAYIDAKSD